MSKKKKLTAIEAEEEIYMIGSTGSRVVVYRRYFGDGTTVSASDADLLREAADDLLEHAAVLEQESTMSKSTIASKSLPRSREATVKGGPQTDAK